MNIAAKLENVDRSKFFKWLSILLIIVTLWFVVHRAWYCDDAYITFRTVDNFANGYRLTWNTYERVQVYTHPLWLFLLIPFYMVTHEIYLTGIFLMVALTAGSLIFLYRSVENKSQLVLPLLGLALSNSFVNFSTSGLENGLLNFLISVALYVYIKYPEMKHFPLLFYFLCSLVTLTRMDAILFVFPAIVAIFLAQKVNIGHRIGIFFLGFLPFFLWEIFSLFYYGFPFPNTFYAKLTAGFPLSDYLWRGLVYLGDSITRDPITVLGILLGLLSILVIPRRMKPLVVGAFLYFLYLFYIGGDFMSGRMFSSLMFLSMILIAFVQVRLKLFGYVIIGLIFLTFGLVADTPSFLLKTHQPINNTVYEIMDERRVYSGGTPLFRAGKIQKDLEMDGSKWSFGGYAWIIEERKNGNIKELPPLERISTGFLGFYGGPQLKIIDLVALSDPLLARLPAAKVPDWRPGHLLRIVPEGYLQSLQDSDARIIDPKIWEYNEHLKVLTQADLFSKGRILEIIRFNLGYYEYLAKE